MTTAQLVELVYATHAAALRLQGQSTPLWEHLASRDRDRWRMAVGVALAQPWAAADIVRHAHSPNTPLVPWQRLPACGRAHWQMLADVARAWRGAVEGGTP